MIAVIDYGMGNIHSVQKALENFGAKTIVTNKPEEIKSCEKIVLPGVGAFGDALSELKKQDLILAINDALKEKKPFLGICLGMQLLFEKSEESPGVKGLAVLKGGVKKFEMQAGLKIPQMGWNQLKKVTKSPSHQVTGDCPLLKNIPDSSYVYFCHSYYPEPADKNIIAATCDYGLDFAAVIWQENIFGVQFHPEKSQSVGLKILENFVRM